MVGEHDAAVRSDGAAQAPSLAFRLIHERESQPPKKPETGRVSQPIGMLDSSLVVVADRSLSLGYCPVGAARWLAHASAITRRVSRSSIAPLLRRRGPPSKSVCANSRFSPHFRAATGRGDRLATGHCAGHGVQSHPTAVRETAGDRARRGIALCQCGSGDLRDPARATTLGSASGRDRAVSGETCRPANSPSDYPTARSDRLRHPVSGIRYRCRLTGLPAVGDKLPVHPSIGRRRHSADGLCRSLVGSPHRGHPLARAKRVEVTPEQFLLVRFKFGLAAHFAHPHGPLGVRVVGR